MISRSDLYENIKSRLTMPDVIERYSIGHINRRKTVLCPFHNDSKPSLRVYDKSFYCFSCGTGGDMINFVARLFELSNHEAAEKLDSDFGLGLSDAKYDAVADMKFAYQRKLQKDVEERYKRKIIELCKMRYELWCKVINGHATTLDEEMELAQAQADIAHLDYAIDNYAVEDVKEVEIIARRVSGHSKRG